MAALFDSGRIVEWILVLILVEAFLLCVLAGLGRRRRGLGSRLSGRLPGLLFNLAAGAFLLLALRAVLADSGWMVAAAWLAAAGMAHVGDLVLRLGPFGEDRKS